MELVKNLITTDDAVETWAKQVINFCHNEMNQKAAQTYLKIYMNEESINSDEEITELLNNKEGGGYPYVLIQRCAALGLTLKNSVALFLDAEVVKTFGECTMISAYLKYQSHQHGNTNVIDMTFFSKYCFPMGFPTDDEWQKLWNSQKVECNYLQKLREKGWASDNILDYRNTYNSLNV